MVKHWRTWPALKSNVDVVVAVYECATFASVRERRVDDAGDYASADEDDDDDVKICALRTVTKAPSKLMKKMDEEKEKENKKKNIYASLPTFRAAEDWMGGESHRPLNGRPVIMQLKNIPKRL